MFLERPKLAVFQFQFSRHKFLGSETLGTLLGSCKHLFSIPCSHRLSVVVTDASKSCVNAF